ncbi:TetR/AcrR family transcriptional regulator [Bryobacter aggregatus]|uniref:TetR/AcrR family transcriptional regulator n=1 Tax=Bryobacter aggregatus TaxID=360054 RepID=UPI0004E14722|nr:TetR/AcrR family transcriptional regulator [Bryobacter aggregatus]
MDTALPLTQHRGRPRSEAANTAILDATLELLETTCYNNLTIEAIAQKAGVGKPTIYRRWKTKAAIVSEAFVENASKMMPLPEDQGSFEANLRALLYLLAERLETSIDGKVLRGLVSESQLDDESSAAFLAFIESRREVLRDMIVRECQRKQKECRLDMETLVDEIYGSVIYRYLLRRQPLNESFLEAHIRFVMNSLAS